MSDAVVHKLVWPAERRFRRERFAEIEPGAVEWLVKNLLPGSGVAIIYGPSTVGKSFFVLWLCIRIARGKTVLNHRTRRSGVLYVAAEGQNGMRKRIKGLREKFKLEADEFEFIGAVPNLLERDDIAALAHEAQAFDAELQETSGLRLGLIVIDTTSASMPGGNENSSESMSVALGNAQYLGEQTGALVMLVSHPGKDESLGVRGWSGQKGNADAVIQLTRDPNDDSLRVGRVEKLKDGQDGERFAYRLKEIDMGKDADGDPVTTAYPEFEQAPAPEKKGAKKPVEQKTGPAIILRAFNQLMDVGQTFVVPAVPGVPPGKIGVERVALRERALSQGHPAVDLKEDSAKRMINRDISELIAARKLREQDGIIWMV